MYTSFQFIVVGIIIITYKFIPLEALAHHRSPFLLKKTTESELDDITSILAEAAIKQEANGILNWPRRFQYLRVKASLDKQLSSRLHVLTLGNSLVLKQSTTTPLLTPIEICRLLVDNDSFRWTLEYAVNCATDDNAWTSHNFALSPQDPSMLQHLMISAHIDSTLIGFCEVAMLPSPDDKREYYPSILNLIVSENYRNKGLASKMVRTVIRFIKSNWMNPTEIRLYVEKSNDIALKLYRKENFVIQKELGDKLYLSKNIHVNDSILDSKSAMTFSR